MRYFLLLLLSACIIGINFSSVQAQTLSLNDLVIGTLTGSDSDTYSLIAREGQMISFVVQATDITLDPTIRITNLNNQTLLSNDDYNYPETSDALIEGFIAPYTGSYSVIVESYGATSGSYALTALAGYSTLSIEDDFESDSGWQAVGLDIVNTPQVSVVNGTANLIQDGIGITGLTVGIDAPSETYFIRTELNSITNVNGWRAGLVFGYIDEQNFYQVMVNFRGAWRLVSVRGGVETTLRDWNIHPAIVPDTQSFALSVLVHETRFDVFYDDQFIGSASDTTFQNGQIGFIVQTSDAIGSSITARFNEIRITEPTLIDNTPVFPTMLVANGTNATIRELQQRLLIPADGEIAFTLSESFAQNNAEGVSRFPIGEGRTGTNLAIGARVTWQASGADLNGCGLIVRDNMVADYVLAYVDSAGGYGLSERSGETFTQNIFNISDDTTPPHDLILIVRDDQAHYFLNGVHVGSLTVGIREGEIAEAVINFEAVNTNCQFNDLWVWEW